MKRIMVIGCCGAGKSTLSKQLQEITQLELIHLDQYYWKPNWTESKGEEWKKVVTSLANKPTWIIDGNYSGTMNVRLEKADTVVFLDFTTLTCLNRVLKRTFKHWGKVRPDMPEGCKERFNLEFLHYVATFNLTRKKALYKKLEGYKNKVDLVVLKNSKEVAQFLKRLPERI